MSARINTRIKLKRDTTRGWDNARGFIPLAGEVIIYSDYTNIEKEIDGETTTVLVPGLKIGDGLTYVQDLPFIDDELRNTVLSHINNDNIHVTINEKLSWWDKLNVNDHSEVIDGSLIFNRD